MWFKNLVLVLELL